MSKVHKLASNELIPPRRKRFSGWSMVAIGASINALASGLFGRGVSLYFLPLARDFNLSRTSTSLIFGVSSLEGGLQGPATGYMIDKWGPRLMMIIGTTLAGIGFLILPFANSFASFLVIFVGVISVGIHSGFHSSVSTIVNNWFYRKRGTAFGIVSVGIALGGTALVPLVALVLQHWDWQTAATLSGVVILAVGIPLSFLVIDTPEQAGQLPDGNSIVGVSGAGNTSSRSDYSAGKAMNTIVYWILAIAICLRISASSGIMVHIVPLVVWKGMTEATGGTVIAVMSFSAIATRFGMGWWGDRWDKKKVVVLAMMGGSTSLAFLAFVPSQTWLVMLFAVSFSLTEGAAGLSWAMVGDYFGRTSYATLRGFITMVVSFGALATPVIAGLVFDTTQSYYWVLIPFSGLYLITAGLFLVLRAPE